MIYPRPNRAFVVRNFESSSGNAIDTGWQEGILSDGRPFRGEYWVEDRVSVLTFFLSRKGIENITDSDFQSLLEKEGLLKFKEDVPRYLSAAPFQDSAGNELWSVNVVVGDEDDAFIDGGLPLREYKKVQPAGAPLTWWIEEATRDRLFAQLWEMDPAFPAFGAAAISLRGLFGRPLEERRAFYEMVATRPRTTLLGELTGADVQPALLKIISKAEFESFDEADWRALTANAVKRAIHVEVLKLDRISPVLAWQLDQVPEIIRHASVLEILNYLEVSKAQWQELAQALRDAPANVRDSLVECSKTVNSVGTFWDVIVDCILPSWKPSPIPKSFFTSRLLEPLTDAKAMEGEALMMRNCLAHRVRRARSGHEVYFHWNGSTPASVQLVHSLHGWELGQIRAVGNKPVDEAEVASITEVVRNLISVTRPPPDRT